MKERIFVNIIAGAAGAFLVWFAGFLAHQPAPAWACAIGALVLMSSVQ